MPLYVVAYAHQMPIIDSHPVIMLQGVFSTLQLAKDYCFQMNRNEPITWNEMTSDNPKFEGQTQIWEGPLTTWKSPTTISIEICEVDGPCIPGI